MLQYVNDLENDRKYKSWPNNVQDILRPTFPGMLRHVAKNFFHLVSLYRYLQITCMNGFPSDVGNLASVS